MKLVLKNRVTTKNRSIIYPFWLGKEKPDGQMSEEAGRQETEVITPINVSGHASESFSGFSIIDFWRRYAQFVQQIC
jgi:hypothetical protein